MWGGGANFFIFRGQNSHQVIVERQFSSPNFVKEFRVSLAKISLRLSEMAFKIG